MSTYFCYFDSAGRRGRDTSHCKETISKKSLFCAPWRSIWWQTSCQKERSCKKIFLGPFRVRFCKQDDANVSLEKQPASRSRFCLVIYGDPLLLFRDVFLPQLFNDGAASRAPCSTKSCPPEHAPRRSAIKGVSCFGFLPGTRSLSRTLKPTHLACAY